MIQVLTAPSPSPYLRFNGQKLRHMFSTNVVFFQLDGQPNLSGKHRVAGPFPTAKGNSVFYLAGRNPSPALSDRPSDPDLRRKPTIDHKEVTTARVVVHS